MNFKLLKCFNKKKSCTINSSASSDLIEEVYVTSLEGFIGAVLSFKKTDTANSVYFRGESEDYKSKALQPSIYRENCFIENEHRFYHEMQRFNDHEFNTDKTTFDKLARMQHYNAPTRLTDLSEDAFTSLHFALSSRNYPITSEKKAVVYLIEIDHALVKYYDSDSVSVVANLAKSALKDNQTIDKSKESIRRDAATFISNINEFNKTKSSNFLLHDIREEKPHFLNIIDPNHIFSVLFIKPKLSNHRIQKQKGAFLLFGLNAQDTAKPIAIIEYKDSKPFLGLKDGINSHPIKKITKLIINCNIVLSELEKLGITTPYIYPEMDKVAEYLKNYYKSISPQKIV